MMNNYSSYLNFWICTAPMDLKFGYVVVHKMRNNFDEESMLSCTRENGVSNLTTSLTS
ncbi:hypothetical protein C1H46_002845 [Malus baccata]|uniref:Uncharacterized protein n=1 Tax=Malus baccata TaxID=106549 RepID=A0A540NLT5_MALBA|nr:hypothetical protein C1H46_002845 [Malus baccata]